MQKKPDFKTSFLALMANGATDDHPAAEALVAFRDDELAAAERERVHRHLTACRECAELARDLDLFAEPTAAEASELEVASFLRTLRPQIGKERVQKPSWQLPLALAASLILAVASSWWLSRSVTERRVLAELSRPRANVSVLDLVADQSERSGSPARTVELVADAGGVLILTPGRVGSFATYQAKILDSEGTLVRTIEHLEKDPRNDTFTLWIPPGGLTLGDYRVELRGLSGAGAEEIATYPIRLIGSPEALP